MLEILLAGSDVRNDTVQHVAEFRSTIGYNTSNGIRIRGSRAGNVDADCAHINFDNFYQTSEYETGEFNLARISADVRKFNTDEAGACGYFRIKTAFSNVDGTTGTLFPDYNTALVADYNGKVGVGTSFLYSNSGADTFPVRRLEV